MRRFGENNWKPALNALLTITPVLRSAVTWHRSASVRTGHRAVFARSFGFSSRKTHFLYSRITAVYARCSILFSTRSTVRRLYWHLDLAATERCHRRFCGEGGLEALWTGIACMTPARMEHRNSGTRAGLLLLCFTESLRMGSDIAVQAWAHRIVVLGIVKWLAARIAVNSKEYSQEQTSASLFGLLVTRPIVSFLELCDVIAKADATRSASLAEFQAHIVCNPDILEATFRVHFI